MMNKHKALMLILLFCLIISSVSSTKTRGSVVATENSWKTKTPIPETISGARAAVVNGKIYVLGGQANFEYDPGTETWTAKKPMPTPRSYFGIAIYQNKIYAIGGRESKANEVYDPTTDTWETKESLSSFREEIDANVVDGKIYIISGPNEATQASEVDGIELNEAYDVATDSWITKKSIPYPVIAYASTVVDGKIYIIGGGCRSNPDWTRTQIYDAKNDSWSFGASLLKVVQGAAAAATTGIMAPKRIYVVGGTEDVRPALNVTQVYDPKNNTWTFGAPMPRARNWLTLVAMNDTLYAVGGSPYFMPYSSVLIDQYVPFGYGTPDSSFISPNDGTQPQSSEPFPTIPVAIASGASIAAVAIGILVYLKKSKR